MSVVNSIEASQVKELLGPNATRNQQKKRLRQVANNCRYPNIAFGLRQYFGMTLHTAGADLRVLQELLAEQVTLITSLPVEAGQRVHELTLKGLEDSTRASEIAKEIMRSGEVTKSRALSIAQTEVSRTATSLTQARAEHVGSPGYIWRTSGDSDVREDHRELEGQFIPWNQPPIADKRTGRRAHAGCI